jgi:hypothetical protein
MCCSNHSYFYLLLLFFLSFLCCVPHPCSYFPYHFIYNFQNKYFTIKCECFIDPMYGLKPKYIIIYSIIYNCVVFGNQKG